ncbi:hypothetical protein L6452_25384 [Arctium lappa]|uniref:Uncharacterized protein n=1 Tax=Arctium lappa TaxID=4217 RepID=A0ACB9AAV5_ARCLA|nr:hypothetical protein L6452_25384 [Arctium lappa]
MADSPSSSPADVLSGFLATFPTLVQEKIRCAFDNLDDDCHWVGLIQFWAPVKIGPRWLLTTSDQPFLLDDNKLIEKYRLRCLKYKYNIDVKNKVQVEDDLTIISDAPATAFLNQTPEFFRELTAHEMSPLASFAVECGLFRSLVLPVFLSFTKLLCWCR